jgi:tetratricopeptide (TPR) repeat protein
VRSPYLSQLQLHAMKSCRAETLPLLYTSNCYCLPGKAGGSPFALALEAATETDAIGQQTFPEAHWRRAAMSSERLEVHIEMRRYTEADALARQMIDVYERTLGTGHPRYASALHTLGFLAYQRGNDAEALQLLRRALSATLSAPAPSARRVALYTRDLGFAHGLNGELDKSRKLLQESISGFMALEPADTTEAAVALSYLATVEFDAGNLDDTDHALDRIQTLRSRPAGINPLRLPPLATATAVARLQAARGRWHDAARTLNLGIAAMPTTGTYPNEVQIEAQLSRAWIQWHRGNHDDARHAEAQARLELARMPGIATHVRRLAMDVAELSRLYPAVDTATSRRQ